MFGMPKILKVPIRKLRKIIEDFSNINISSFISVGVSY